MGRRRKKQSKISFISPEIKFSILGLIFIALGILIIISFFEKGLFLIFINHFLIKYFGSAVMIMPFTLICLGLFFFKIEVVWSRFSAFFGSLLLFLAVLFLFQQGELGKVFFHNIASLISVFGAYVVFGFLFISALLITFNLSSKKLFFFLKTYQIKRVMQKRNALTDVKNDFVSKNNENTFLSKFNFNFHKKDDGVNFDSDMGLNKINIGNNQKQKENSLFLEKKVVVSPIKKIFNKDDLPKIEILKSHVSLNQNDQEKSLVATQIKKIWEYPPLSIFENKLGGQAERGDVKKNATIIENTLESFGIKARVVEVNRGPSVTQYGLEIVMGTKISKITGLATDLALALAAPTGQIRIEAPIAGRSLVGVEVPNHKASYVTLREMLEKDEFRNHLSKLAVSLGIDVSGKPIIGDIAKMPHVLIAGATGSGKSVGLNAFLCSILFRCSPDEVRLILVDPKRVELTFYNDIPHLLCPVIVEAKEVVSVLMWATGEMENRYKKLQELKVKTIDDYNLATQEKVMPRIIIVLDEFADIMLFAPSEVEEAITRLAQMSRAVGIHLILATQRPSVNVITGLIKANIPTRIAFNVSSMMDSRVILDLAGAEKLLGNGDMLFIPPDRSKPIRIQGTFVSDKDIHSLINFLKNENYPVEHELDIVSKFKIDKIRGFSSDKSGKDDKFDEAVQLVAQYDSASSSAIQRRLSVGYARAARILDQLYEHGLVGPANGSKPREINQTKIMEYLSSNNH